MAGTVYLIHFNTPLSHARHYLGWTSNLKRRLAEHQAGSGARLMAVVAQQGITWRLARTWKGGRASAPSAIPKTSEASFSKGGRS
jgi:predicted GIY-YIG superfamily endonuclease